MRKNLPRSVKLSGVSPSSDARLCVERYGVAPHYEVFNAVGVEDGQEFFEVWVHLEPRPSSHRWQE